MPVCMLRCVSYVMKSRVYLCLYAAICYSEWYYPSPTYMHQYNTWDEHDFDIQERIWNPSSGMKLGLFVWNKDIQDVADSCHGRNVELHSKGVSC